jgi:DNA (cytosine-5)-methyltransferase 1
VRGVRSTVGTDRRAGGRPGRPRRWTRALEARERSRPRRSHRRLCASTETVGFAPSCGHDAPHVPGVVLDPFAGAGTTGSSRSGTAARSSAANSPADYVRLARDRIIADSPLLNTHAEVWFCEQDEFCQRVLAKHWPGVPCHPDVRALVANTGRGRLQPDGVGRGLPVAPEGAGRGEQRRPASIDPAGGGSPDGQVLVPVPYVDVLCGGFPCQDLSYAGRGAGLDGERSGLWIEYARLIRELRPRYVIVENVSALLARGLGRVLGDLAACGYDAEWDCIPASAVGAPHRRDRVWLVAYPGGDDGGPWGQGRPTPSGAGESVAVGALQVADADGESQGWPAIARPERHQWLVEPNVGRVAHGIPARVDRLRSLGNALVPQIAEWLGRRIIEHEGGGG